MAPINTENQVFFTWGFSAKKPFAASIAFLNLKGFLVEVESLQSRHLPSRQLHAQVCSGVFIGNFELTLNR